MRSRLLAAGAIGAAFALGSMPAAADSSTDVGQLRQEAAQLRQSLERLEAHIQAIESQSQGQSQSPSAGKTVAAPTAPAPQVPTGASTPAAPASPVVTPAALAAAVRLDPIVSLKRNWSQIERGMAQEQVQALLGDPEKVMKIDGNTAWLYAYPGIGRGSVFLNRDGKVSSSQSPTFGWGW